MMDQTGGMMMRLCGSLTLALLVLGAGCSDGSGALPRGETDAAVHGSSGASPGGGINRREFAVPATTTKTFLDYLKPTPITCSPLSSATWGVAGVLPRDLCNGIESAKGAAVPPDYYYWDGQILRANDGKYHLFMSTWAGSAGFNPGWTNSDAYHAISTQGVLGPYTRQGYVYTNSGSHKGHNVSALELPDGTYAVIVSETVPFTIYKSSSLDGPWTSCAPSIQANGIRYSDSNFASNVSLFPRHDGKFEIVQRHGHIGIADTLCGPYKLQKPTWAFPAANLPTIDSIYPKRTSIPGVPNPTYAWEEDPHIWRSAGTYHVLYSGSGDRVGWHVYSADGINNWTDGGLAFSPREYQKIFCYEGSTTCNQWYKMERPSVVLQDGHVTHATWAVSDVDKDNSIPGGSNHGSKIIVVPFDGVAFDNDFGSVPPSNPPTVATPAAASSNPVTGLSTALSVLGADDGGEANLTYTWATTGTPPAAVTFSANGSNAAKATTATFSKAGSYILQVTIKDQGNQTVTSSVTVTVDQTFTSIVVAPATASVNPSATQPFTATARDQFATNLSTQPTFTWSASGGGTISSTGLFTAGTAVGGPYTVSAQSGGFSGTANVTVASAPIAVYQINTGSSSAVSPFTGDQYGSGGTQRTVTNAINVSGVTNPAPTGVYQSERWGNSTYTLPNLTAGRQYLVRLHFAELYQTATGKRVFNVAINGTTVLSNFDIYAAAGTNYKAVVREFTATANTSGQMVITFTTVTDNATIEGIEVLALNPNTPPTIAAAASAAPNPATGTTSSLAVLGADDAGEASLSYTWATLGTPPAPVTFSANGSNAAKNTTATFSKAGSYTLQASVADQAGLTATSSVVVTVDQTLTSIVVAPAASTIAPLASQQLVATARDQFTTALVTQPAFTWSVSGGGDIDADGLFTAGASPGGPFTVTAASGSLIGTATVSVEIPNAGPTIATAAAADPNPVTDNTSSLSVLGDDDGGEANLTYTWATTGTPPAAVTFSANGSNAAKNTIATFTKAGSYTLRVTVADQPGLSVTSQVTVTVDQTLTSIVVSPSSATVNTSASQPFTATGRDQFATALAMQPTFTWTVSGGGTVSPAGLFTAGTSAGGPFPVTATAGGVSGTASVTVSAAPTTIYQIDTGSSSANSPFSADQYGSGGTAYSVTSAITISGITNPAPQAVYQSERYGNSTYTLPNLTAGSQYTVRLHFAELYQTATGKRVFNVVINGTTVLSNFDIYAATGARYKATVREFTATANSSGQIVINFQTVTDNASITGIELIALTPNSPPAIATPAAATPNPVSGTTASLSALGDDDGGEANLTYTWATTGTPPAAVSFSANGSNAAKNTVATFGKAGNYTLQVTVRDAPGLTVTSQVAVTVAETLTSIVVAPTSSNVDPLATQQFAATARDQFTTALSTQPTFAWSVSGGGTIDATGLFTAGTSGGGPYTVTATSGAVSGTATISVTVPNNPPSIGTPAAANPSPVTGSTTALSVAGDDDGGESNLTYTWATMGTPPAGVAFSANGTNAAKNTTATFAKAGSYTFQVTVRDQPGLTASSLVTVIVDQTLTSIAVSPSSASVNTSATQQFTASARDQFATALPTQPSFTWTVSGGGTISSAGLFSAGSTAGGPYTVTAASGGKSGTASVTVSGGTSPCAGLCTGPVVFTTQNYQSGNLGTGATCHETTANLNGGNCSNISSRTLKVNNTTMSCNGWALPAKRNGGYCIQVTAGTPNYTSFATW